jgi:hypothetical protein
MKVSSARKARPSHAVFCSSPFSSPFPCLFPLLEDQQVRSYILSHVFFPFSRINKMEPSICGHLFDETQSNMIEVIYSPMYFSPSRRSTRWSPVYTAIFRKTYPLDSPFPCLFPLLEDQHVRSYILSHVFFPFSRINTMEPSIYGHLKARCGFAKHPLTVMPSRLASVLLSFCH